jgi:hypothetical protein
MSTPDLARLQFGMTFAAFTWSSELRWARPGVKTEGVGGVALKRVPHPSIEERKTMGRKARERTPASSHCGWRPAVDRADPVALIEEQDLTREADLISVRHGRMMVSPFTDFSERYADQNERDFQEFVKAIRSGRLQAHEGV